MKKQEIKIGEKVAYEVAKNEFKTGVVNDVRNGLALVNSRWHNIKNLELVTKTFCG